MNSWIRTIHYRQEIKNHADFINLFHLLEQEARDKKLSISAVNGEFRIFKIGKPVGDGEIFKTDCMEAVNQFVQQYAA